MADGGTVNEAIFDRMVSHRLALLRYETGLTRRLLATYDAAYLDVLTRAEELSARIDAGKSVDRRQLERLRELAGELADGAAQLRTALAGKLTEGLQEAADTERTVQGANFRDIGAGFAQVPDEQVAAALAEAIGGDVYADRIAADLRAATGEIQDAVAIGLARGDSMPEVARQLARVGAVVQTYRGRLVAIARTEVQRVANTVALRAYQRNADVLAGVQWLATLDSRTCPLCAALHNRAWTLEETQTDPTFRRPPRHPRCRCFLAPISKSWEQLGLAPTRGHDGEPAGDTTFASWLRRQTKATQEDVLGSAKKRRMWLAGLPLERFSIGNRVLGIGELRALYPSYAD